MNTHIKSGSTSQRGKLISGRENATLSSQDGESDLVLLHPFGMADVFFKQIVI